MQHAHPHGGAEHDKHQRADQSREAAGNGAARGQPFPEHAQHQHGEVGGCGNGKGQADHKGNILVFKGNTEDNGQHAQAQRGGAGDAHFFFRLRPSFADHRRINVVAHRRCARQGQPGHHRQNGGEGNGGDKAQQQVAADGCRQMHRRHIGAADHFVNGFAVFDHRFEKLGIVGQENNRAKADDKGEQVEIADKAGGDDHRFARLAGVGHGEKAHQDMRQTGGAEHQRQAERERVHRVFHQAAGREYRLAARMRIDGFLEHRLHAETAGIQHHKRHKRCAAQQQYGFNHLHPSRRQHAAEQHIGHHQRADNQYRRQIIHAEQKLNQLARAHHLRDEIQHHHQQRTRSGKQAHRRLFQAIGRHIGKGKLPQIAQPLSHQKQHQRPADQKARRINQAVVTGGEHHRRNAQKRRGRHKVARNRQPVLKAGDAAACGVKVFGGTVFRRRPLGNPQRRAHEDEEHNHSRPVGRLFLHLAAKRIRPQAA